MKLPGSNPAKARLPLVVLLACACALPAAAQTPQDSARTLAREAMEAYRLGSREGLERSVEVWLRAAELYRRGGDRAAQGRMLNNIAVALGRSGRPDSALVYARQALAIHRDVGNQQGVALTLRTIGPLYAALGRPDSALVYYRLELVMVREAGDRQREIEMLSTIGEAQADLGRSDSALVYHRQALSILREVGDRQGEGATLANIAATLRDLGRPDSALVYDRQALTILREVGDRKGEGATLSNMGVTHWRLGRPDSALFYYREALLARREVRDRKGEGVTLHNIGVVQSELGRPDSALGYYREALAIAEEVGDRRSEGGTRNSIGVTQGVLGRPDSAITYYRQALVIFRELRDRRDEGAALSSIGIAQSKLGRLDSALVYLHLALLIQREVGDRTGEGATLFSIGMMQEGLGRHDSALVYCRQALAIAREVGDRKGEGEALAGIGAEHAQFGRPDSAIVYYRQALVILREIGDREGEGTALSILGLLFHQRSRRPDLGSAAAYYDSAAAVTASIGAHAGGEANRVGFAELSVPVFESWTLAWLARAPEVGRTASALAALATVERGRAQALLELMRRTNAEATAGRDLAAEGARLATASTLGDVGVLSYLVTADTILIWVLRPGGQVEVVRQAVSRDTLASLVRSLRDALGVGTSTVSRGFGMARAGAGSADRLRDLARLLLPPELDRRLGSVRELVVVPNGVLGLVPFAALPPDTGDTPLGSRYALRYAPSLAVLAEAERRPGLPAGASRAAVLRRALVVGNAEMPSAAALGEAFALSPLPGAAVEAEGVATRLGVRMLTSGAASEAAVRGRLPGAPVVHLATHGYAYATDARSRQSFVALAPDANDDGFLTVGEILDDPALTLSADLVVLSACQTGLGDLKQAEGTVGLQRAFLAKGARSVLVSLWNVSDEATALLMRRFYAHWMDDADHPSKAEALRRAQEAVRANPRFAAPQYWAAFQLVGAR